MQVDHPLRPGGEVRLLWRQRIDLAGGADLTGQQSGQCGPADADLAVAQEGPAGDLQQLFW